MINASGAKTNPMADILAEMNKDMPSYTGKTIGMVERPLRSFFSAGLVPYAERTIGQAASGKATGATRRQLAEMGIDIDLIPKDADYQASAHTVRNAFPQLTGRLHLLSNDPGQQSRALTGNQWGRVAGQYRPFSLGTYGLFRDDYVEPVLAGLKNRDMSELALAGGRLARQLPSAAALSAVSSGLVFGQTLGGDKPDPREILKRAVSGTVGWPADVGLSFLMGKGGYGKVKDTLGSLTPPLAGILDDPETLALMGLGAYAPRTGGAASLLYPAIKKRLPWR